MIVTESELRDQLRRPAAGAQVTVPAGARLSPSAADFVKQWQLVVVEQSSETVAAATDWDREAVFPVVRDEAPVRCTQCGSPVTDKPDSLTQLNACHFTAKTHPRIRLRGRMDSLHALLLLCQSLARQPGPSWLASDLATLAAYCREVTSAEYNERPVAELVLEGWDAEQLHRATHDPDGVLGVPHLTIAGDSPLLQHWLNLCRTTAREIELVALDAFESPHHPYGASICHGLNRLSSACYFLQLRLAKEVGG